MSTSSLSLSRARFFFRHSPFGRWVTHVSWPYLDITYGGRAACRGRRRRRGISHFSRVRPSVRPSDWRQQAIIILLHRTYYEELSRYQKDGCRVLVQTNDSF